MHWAIEFAFSFVGGAAFVFEGIPRKIMHPGFTYA